MTTETKRIRIEPDSEVVRLLEEADKTTVLLEKDGELYRLTKEADIWAGYDPQRTRNTLQKSVGALHGVDREQLIADIHQAREQDSPGRPA